MNELKRLRKEKGLTQKELADKLGVHYMTIYNIESGKSKTVNTYLKAVKLLKGKK